MKFAVLIPMFLAVTFAISPATSRISGSDEPQRIAIVAKRFEFSPAEITLKKGVPVVLTLTSEDVEHGLKFKGLDLTIKAKKGETSEATFTPTEAGTFVGQCSVFCGAGHGGMKLTLHVTE